MGSIINYGEEKTKSAWKEKERQARRKTECRCEPQDRVRARLKRQGGRRGCRPVMKPDKAPSKWSGSVGPVNSVFCVCHTADSGNGIGSAAADLGSVLEGGLKNSVPHQGRRISVEHLCKLHKTATTPSQPDNSCLRSTLRSSDI